MSVVADEFGFLVFKCSAARIEDVISIGQVVAEQPHHGFFNFMLSLAGNSGCCQEGKQCQYKPAHHQSVVATQR